MKPHYIIFILFVLLSFPLFSQEGDGESKTEQVVYTYDNAGNRITRTMQTITLKDEIITKTEEDKGGKGAEEQALSQNSYEEQLATSKIIIYPNPTKGLLKVDITNIDTENASMVIYNMQGAQVYRDSKVKAHNKIDLSDKDKGSYIMKIFLGNESSIWKIVKE